MTMPDETENNNAPNESPAPAASPEPTAEPVKEPVETSGDQPAPEQAEDKPIVETGDTVSSTTSATAQKVNINITGALKGNVEVAAGTPLNEALSSLTSSAGSFTLKDSNGKSVSGNTSVTSDMTLTASAKTSGG